MDTVGAAHAHFDLGEDFVDGEAGHDFTAGLPVYLGLLVQVRIVRTRKHLCVSPCVRSFSFGIEYLRHVHLSQGATVVAKALGLLLNVFWVAVWCNQPSWWRGGCYGVKWHGISF